MLFTRSAGNCCGLTSRVVLNQWEIAAKRGSSKAFDSFRDCTKCSELNDSESSEAGDYNKQSTLASGKVTLIETLKKWDEKVSEANRNGKMIVVNFSASWCSPCRAIAPPYCNLAAIYESLVFLTVDVDELSDFSTSWEIKATPTFLFLKDGKEEDRLVGADVEDLVHKTEAFAAANYEQR